MSSFKCETCGYTTKTESVYKRHLNKKIPCKKKKVIEEEESVSKQNIIENKNPFTSEEVARKGGKTFKTITSSNDTNDFKPGTPEYNEKVRNEALVTASEALVTAGFGRIYPKQTSLIRSIHEYRVTPMCILNSAEVMERRDREVGINKNRNSDSDSEQDETYISDDEDSDYHEEPVSICQRIADEKENAETSNVETSNVETLKKGKSKEASKKPKINNFKAKESVNDNRQLRNVPKSKLHPNEMKELYKLVERQLNANQNERVPCFRNAEERLKAIAEEKALNFRIETTSAPTVVVQKAQRIKNKDGSETMTKQITNYENNNNITIDLYKCNHCNQIFETVIERNEHFRYCEVRKEQREEYFQNKHDRHLDEMRNFIKAYYDLFVYLDKTLEEKCHQEKILITFMKTYLVYELEGKEMDFLENYTKGEKYEIHEVVAERMKNQKDPILDEETIDVAHKRTIKLFRNLIFNIQRFCDPDTDIRQVR